MINFYDKLSKDIKNETKLDKNFKNHYILPNSMIAIIGVVLEVEKVMLYVI